MTALSNIVRHGGIGPQPRDMAVRVQTRDIDRVRSVTLQVPGGKIRPVKFNRGKDGVQFDLPGRTCAALVELHLR